MNSLYKFLIIILVITLVFLWYYHQETLKKQFIYYQENILQPNIFSQISSEIDSYKNNAVYNNFYSFRKASVLTKDQLIDDSEIIKLYYNPEFINYIRNLTKLNLNPVSDTDKSNINVLIYDQPGDHINWHYDPNHYMGIRCTVLLSIVNRGDKGLSSSKLSYIYQDKLDSIQMVPNSLLCFNGSDVLHKASPIVDNEERILISFTYCDDETINPFKIVDKVIKEYVLY